jgi:uncharacterized membrane protein
MTPDQIARSMLDAAWSSRNAAWWTFGGTVVVGILNVAVLVYLAVRTSGEARRARNARLYAVAISISHALEIVRTCFDKIGDLAPEAVLNLSSVRRDLELAKRAINATPNEIDDADLMSFKRNTGTLVGAIDETAERLPHTGTPAWLSAQEGVFLPVKTVTAAKFLEATQTLRADTERELANLDEFSGKWRERL